MKVFVGHSFSENLPEKYYEQVKKIYMSLYQNHHEIYVGGLHKKLKDALEICGEKLTCYSVERYKKEKELCKKCTYKIVKNSIKRTEELIVNTDWQVFLPGGTGTLSEIFQAIEYNRELKMQKPILLYNEDKHYDIIIEYIENLIKKQYNEVDTKKYISVLHSIEELEKIWKEGN